MTVGFAVDVELPPDGVADASFQTTESFSGALAFGEFASVVGAAGCVVADLDDGGDVEGVVELPVPRP